MKIRLLFAIVAVVASLAVAGRLAVLADWMAPIQSGNAIDFWESLCRCDLNDDGNKNWLVSVYSVDDNWFAYDSCNYHGSDVCRVAVSEVELMLPEVSQRLHNQLPDCVEVFVVEGHKDWLDLDAPRTASALVSAINDRYRNRRAVSEPEILVLEIEDEVLFWGRWRAANWYWASLLFEWLFLSCWVGFLLWPGMVGSGSWRWGVHLAIAMPVFFLPAYLGYATYSFTSAGPTGGVLYPHMLWALRGGSMTDNDVWLFEHLPPFLESISAPIGSPIVLTGMGVPGIIGVAKWGVLCGLLVVVSDKSLRWIARGYFRNYDRHNAVT